MQWGKISEITALCTAQQNLITILAKKLKIFFRQTKAKLKRALILRKKPAASGGYIPIIGIWKWLNLIRNYSYICSRFKSTAYSALSLPPKGRKMCICRFHNYLKNDLTEKIRRDWSHFTLLFFTVKLQLNKLISRKIKLYFWIM